MMMQAKEDLEGYSEDAGAFFGGAIPSVMAEDVMAGAQMHAMQLLMSMDAYAAGDYDMAFSKQREAHKHVAGLASALVG